MGKRKKGNPVNGWVCLDKPEGMTSTQAVGRVRWLLNAQKAGHAGTLDPLASGILPIALGEATKTVPYVQDASKVYHFTAIWGEARTTDDREGDVTDTSDIRPTMDEVNAILPDFTGEINQTPPRFSAIKINGERAYDLARDGQDFEIKSRTVMIHDIRLVHHTDTESGFEVHCGKGTYVRALARDMALKLGTYAYVGHLRRLSVGPFSEENAIPLDEFEKMVQSAPLEDCVLPVETALDDIPALELTVDEANRLKNGQSVRLLTRQDQKRLIIAGFDTAQTAVALATVSGAPVALVTMDGPELKPVRVLNL